MLESLEQERLKTAGERHRQWEERLQMKLTRIENHAVVIHAQMSSVEARRVAEALEAMTSHLQQHTGSMLLTNRRPATDDMLLLADQTSYQLALDDIKERETRIKANWELLQRVVGASLHRISVIRKPDSRLPLEHIAVHISAGCQMQLATSYRAPDWLSQGFGAYCEYTVLRRNLMHGIAPQSAGTLRMDANWDVQLRRLAALGGLRSWEEMFTTDLAVYEPVHYFEAKSIVTFLLREPEKFLRFVELLAGKSKDADALVEAYEKPLEELESDYRRWLGLRR